MTNLASPLATGVLGLSISSSLYHMVYTGRCTLNVRQLITSAASEDRLHLYLNLSSFFMNFFLGPMMGINNSKDLSGKLRRYSPSIIFSRKEMFGK